MSAALQACCVERWVHRTLTDQARQDLDAARRLNPRLRGLDTLIGITMEYAGDLKGAAAAFEKAIEGNPNDFEAQLRLGAAQYAERQLVAARMHIERALEIDPTSSVARYELARVESAQGQVEAAVRDLEKAVQGDPDWLPPHVQLAAPYYHLNRPEDGAREKKIVDRLNARHPQRAPESPILTPTLPAP